VIRFKIETMEIEHVHDRSVRYTLTNEGLQVGDKVFPIAMGRKRDDGSWVLHEFHWQDYMCGFPLEPHEIVEFEQNKGEQYREIRTNHGSSPEYCYFKIIKKECQQKSDSRFPAYSWVEIV